jgi:tellurite resistance protein TehA-like permease
VDQVHALVNIVFFLLIVFLISRVAHYFNTTKQKLDEIDKKILTR